MKKNKTNQNKVSTFTDLKLSLFLAWKSIQRGNKASFFLVIGIMMIVFLNLLFTDAIFAGITKGMNANKINFQYGEIIIEPSENKDFIENPLEVISYFKNNENVEKISQIINFGVSFINQKEKDGQSEKKMAGLLMGIDLKNNGNDFVFNIKDKIIAGRMLREGEVGKIIIGTNLAGGYGASVFPTDLGAVRPGDKILVERGKNKKEFEIVGIFKTKNFDIDARGIIPEKELRQMMKLNIGANEIIFRLSDKNKSTEFTKELKAKFPNYQIYDWNDKLAFGAAISKSFEMIGSILRIIGSIVAGLVIFIIIFVEIVNRRRQIGIMKSMGIKQKVIIHSYILRGIFYTGLGSIFGFLLMKYGIIATFEQRPIDMPMTDLIPFLKNEALLASVIFFILAGLIGSAIPAYREIKKKILILLYH